MRAHARGARPASSAARTSAGDGLRGSPVTRKVSSAYPASGTSCASTRSGDPANVTWTLRLRSSSATASAGSTCPAVPPAAIRHLSCRSTATPRDVKEDAHRHELHHEARAAVRNERKRDSGQRSHPEHGREVDRGLAGDESGNPGGEPLAERIDALERDLQSGPGEERVREDERAGADEPQLLADHGEDHVRVSLGQEVELPDALPEPVAEEAARAEADLRLHDLISTDLRV